MNNFFSRRKFFHLAFQFLSIFFFHPFIGKTRAWLPKKINSALDFDLRQIERESLSYRLSFLWFKDAARGEMIFKKVKKGYLAIMRGETKGFIGWLTSYRKHTYISHLNLLENRKGFRSVLFEREVIVKDKREKTLNYFDYKNRIFSWKIYKNKRLIEEAQEEIPRGIVYEDILSAFYNFRTGLYGEIIKGKEYIINTLPSEGVTNFQIQVADIEEEQKMRKKEGRRGEKGYLVYVKVPKVIFNSKKGVVRIWFDANLIPQQGIIEDAIGFGDIIGILEERRVKKVYPQALST